MIAQNGNSKELSITVHSNIFKPMKLKTCGKMECDIKGKFGSVLKCF